MTKEQVRAVEKTAYQPHHSKGEWDQPKEGNLGKAGSSTGTGVEDDLDAHTVDELRTIAHREGAEVRHDMVKADIIRSIKKERKKA